MLRPRRTPSLAALATLPLTFASLGAGLAACDSVTDPSARPSLALARGAAPVTASPVWGYQVEQLPILPAGINDSGVVVGMRAGEAVHWFNGSLGTLPHLNYVAGSYEAHAINRRGAVVGGVANGVGLYWRTVQSMPLQIVPFNGVDQNRYVAAYAINNSDVVVGSFDHLVDPRNGRSQDHAFRWRPDGAFEDITPKNFFGGAVAVDINEAGYIVGYGYPATGDPPQALRWPPNYPASPVEVLDQPGSEPRAINDHNLAIGYTYASSDMVGWYAPWQGFALDGPVASTAYDISNLDRLVGASSEDTPGYPNLPFTVYKKATTWLPVPAYAGKASFFALRVNTCGDIIGSRQDWATGERVGFRWTRPTQCDLGVIFQP